MKIRDKEAFILFVAGTSLSFFIVMNGIQLLDAWFIQATRGMEERQYQNCVELTIIMAENLEEAEFDMTQENYWRQMEKTERMLELLAAQETDAAIYLVLHPYIGADAESQRGTVYVLLAGSEDWYRTLQSGAYPVADWQEKDGLAVISEAAGKYVEIRQGKPVIRINDKDYQVVGRFENYQMSAGDVEICLYYVPVKGDYVNQETAWAFQNNVPRKIYLGSNQEEVWETAEKLKVELEEAVGYPVTISEYKSEAGNGMDMFYARIKATVLVVVFLVSLLNVRQITSLWITRKKRELVIQKTFGMGDRQIIGRLLRELLQMLLWTLALIICLNMIYNGFIHREGTEWRLALQNGGLLMGAVLIVIAVTLIPIFRGVRQIVPAQGLRGE